MCGYLLPRMNQHLNRNTQILKQKKNRLVRDVVVVVSAPAAAIRIARGQQHTQLRG